MERESVVNAIGMSRDKTVSEDETIHVWSCANTLQRAESAKRSRADMKRSANACWRACRNWKLMKWRRSALRG